MFDSCSLRSVRVQIALNVSLSSGDPLFKRPTRSASAFYTSLDTDAASAEAEPAVANTTPPTTADPVESRVDSTRVDNEEIINRLMESNVIVSSENDCVDGDEQGLQLFVGKDGSATLGSRSGTNKRKNKPLAQGHFRQSSSEAGEQNSLSTSMSRQSSGSIPTQSSAEA